MITITQTHATCQQDPGILAIALNSLADFAPTFVPAEGRAREHVQATCPVCIGEVGSLGALKVEIVDVPPRLSWRCSLHRGDFPGIDYALAKHRAKGSDLVLPSTLDSSYSDQAAEAPILAHRAELRCTNARWKSQKSAQLGAERTMSLRCRRCAPCAKFRKEHRQALALGRLPVCAACASDHEKGRSLRGQGKCSAGCVPIRMVDLSKGEYATATRLLRAHKRPFVGIPTTGGRVLLTRSKLVLGEEVASADLVATVARLVDAMPEGTRVSVSAKEPTPGASEREVPEKAPTDWVDIGTTKLNVSEQAKVYGSYGCTEVRVQREGGTKGGTVAWSVAHLSPDDLLKLHHSLGLRITRGRR